MGFVLIEDEKCEQLLNLTASGLILISAKRNEDIRLGEFELLKAKREELNIDERSMCKNIAEQEL